MDDKGVRSHSHTPAHVMLKKGLLVPIDDSLGDSIISAVYKKQLLIHLRNENKIR